MTKNILIVDDSSIMRKMVARSVRQAGFNIHEAYEAANGIEGLASLDKHSDIALILTDWNMPQMDGLTFVRRVRERGVKTPILMITTESNHTHMNEALKAGVDGYIQKPFTPEDLEEKLKNFL